MYYSIAGIADTEFQRWMLYGLVEMMQQHGYQYVSPEEEGIQLVLHFVDSDKPRPYRRKAQATYVVSVVEVNEMPSSVLRSAYPLLIRSLSNLLLYLVRTEHGFLTYFVTLEQGAYEVPLVAGKEKRYFQQLFERLEPLATSTLIINNDFNTDLPEPLWEGDEITQQVRWASKKIDAMQLWPAPFPIQDMLPPEDFRHVKRLYGIGGLSYGNLSARKDERRFWMSASGVNKGNLQKVGTDMLLVEGFNPDRRSIQLSVPPNLTPRRVSVDAIEHWMIYTEHPQVGAVVHIHAWMDGVSSTQINYPCGTVELAKAVADLVRKADDPSRTIVGLKNHGLTITGPSLEDIFERIDGRVIPQVPMS